jgi:hypothetical protein
MQEITPNRYRCGFVAECPAAFRLEDGRILLIGKKAESPVLDKISGRIGADEYAVVVEPGLLENIFPK